MQDRRILVQWLMACFVLAVPVTAAADDGFRTWLKQLRAEAVASGIDGVVFDREMRDIKPDRSLPDLEVGKRPKLSNKGQAEFTKPPQDYVKRDYIKQLAAEGRALKERYASALGRIEQTIGVDRSVVLAIWGRETAYGKYKPRHDAIRALATQAYLGRRKDMFRGELLAALRLIQTKAMTRSEMRASWAGAMGLPQLMPSEFEKYAVDIDGDGRIDIFRSVPDALGTAARQLKEKGWVKGLKWGFEVRLGRTVTCAFEGAPDERSIGEWTRAGVQPASGVGFKATPEVRAYLMSPAGANGPSFLVTENFKVIRRYNMSDLYALFVGHLADRIEGGSDFKTPWKGVKQLTGAEVGEIQERLKGLGYPISIVDGKVGSNTRRTIGRYQVAQKTMPVCWPSEALLRHMRSIKAPK
ncbi:MAG: hypothetical protein RLZ98_3602 [Pseudomonadota bacterium]|jgi:lytic murein transglycosylase